MNENDDNGEEGNDSPNEEADTDERQEAVEFDGDYGVSTSNPTAQQVGMDVLEEGGNAVDAAIAVSFALGVVEPYGSGLGGGGAMLVLDNPAVEPDYYDYREMSPEEGRENEAAVPGFLKGMAHIHEQHGSLPMEQLMEPAIDYAENGYEVDHMLANRLDYAGSIENPDGRIDPDAAEEFYPGGMAIQEGEELVQSRLADTLTHLQEHGLEDFYTGSMASEVAGDRSSITEEDLANYEVLEPDVASGTYNGNQVYSSGAPTSGVTFIQMLQMAEQVQINDEADDGAAFAHLFAEISEQAYSDRVSTIGDPEFSDVNVDRLTSEEYTQGMASDIDTDPAGSGEEQAAAPEVDDDGNTTHFVVVDEEGHMVSATNTLSNFFGSGQMTETGFFLNDQMSNFAPEDLPPNDYDSGKRARSFIAPSIIINEDEGTVTGMGSPGGRRIPQIMSQVMINHERLDGDIEEAMNVPRFIYDDQEGVDQILYEDGWEDEERIERLSEMGYLVEERVTTVFFGGVQMLEVDYGEGTVEDILDERRR